MPKKNRNITFYDVSCYKNVHYACKKCLSGVRWKASTQLFDFRLDENAERLHKQLVDGSFKSKGFKAFTIHERGKKRPIHSVHISERAAQKTLTLNALRPIIVPRLIPNNFATLPGRGTDGAIISLKHHLAKHYQKHGLNGGILIGDYSSYYASINHYLLLDMYDSVIYDRKIMKLVKYFIDQFEELSEFGIPEEENPLLDKNRELFDEETGLLLPDEVRFERYAKTGLGLGSEISQTSGIFYLNPVDHHISDAPFIDFYERYMDDFVVVSHDLESLKEIELYVYEESSKRGLRLNPKRTKVMAFENEPYFRFLKKRFSFTDTGKVLVELPNKNFSKHAKQMENQFHLFKEGIITADDICEAFLAWRGSISWYDSRNHCIKISEKLLDIYGPYLSAGQIRKIKKF